MGFAHGNAATGPRRRAALPHRDLSALGGGARWVGAVCTRLRCCIGCTCPAATSFCKVRPNDGTVRGTFALRSPVRPNPIGTSVAPAGRDRGRDGARPWARLPGRHAAAGSQAGPRAVHANRAAAARRCPGGRCASRLAPADEGAEQARRQQQGAGWLRHGRRVEHGEAREIGTRRVRQRCRRERSAGRTRPGRMRRAGLRCRCRRPAPVRRRRPGSAHRRRGPIE